MRQITTFRKISLVGALLFGSASAFAQLPAVPGDTSPAGPFPDPNTGNGGLIVAVWDPVQNVSLIQWLGLRYNDITPANMQPAAGGTMNFGVLDQWNTVFNDGTPSDPANLLYAVHAVSFSGTVANRQLAATGSILGTGTVLRSAISAATTAGRDFENVNILGGCPTQNSCVALTSPSQVYAGQVSYDGRLNDTLPATANMAGSVGAPLAFYNYTVGAGPLNQAGAVDRYDNATGFATWLLTAGGNLTYSIPGAVGEVPLPAAVWLLLSGLAGFGAVSRKRQAGGQAA